ncbi:MAG: porin family protein [Acidobacteriaceae bacterium]|nr:porin family protein [Acidobacteriaceae bacterium]
MLSAPPLVHAQFEQPAKSTHTARKEAEVSVYAGYTRFWPNIGPADNNGATFGLDYSQFFRNWFLTPVIELRGRFAQGADVDMSSWGGGVRLEHAFGKFRPFVDYQFGKGTLDFNFVNLNRQGKPETSNDSFIFSPGVGLDYDITRQFAARVEYRAEYWGFGANQSLRPKALTFGTVYRFHFGRL